ncbi:discoidin domain-containing protein [Luteolibacter sp. SL250]|uniref:discoidin domain-containing protein n=1 Tax=Luteolibacter sp. SL250 TaxID=2995170 RepID=UPI00226FB9AE|nr:discoidin domain-containing protein [Luteolibacter sp. SL250]WAC21091.1 discoidin domain-containing protein [Luteolibacter sp. SL250]
MFYRVERSILSGSRSVCQIAFASVLTLPLFGVSGLLAENEVSGPLRGAKVSASSVSGTHDAKNAADGDATDASAWVGGGEGEGQWLQLDFPSPVRVSEVQLHSGLRSIKGSLVTAGEIQVKEGADWKKVGEFSNNRFDELRITVPGGLIETSSLRLWTVQKGEVAVRELALYPQSAALGEGLGFYGDGTHMVSVNQIAYNDGYPKRFTVPTAIKDGAKFSVRKAGSDKEALFTGDIRAGTGDFSAWNAGKDGGDYTIHVEGGGMDAEKSFPFAVGERALQKSLLQPMVDFMVDARSVVGTHPSAYGGAAWRDGSYYTHELASLVMLYLAFPDEISEMPRQIDWQAEQVRVLSPDFKWVPTRGDNHLLEAARYYYRHYEAPAADAPDAVKLIHWGCGMTMAKPKIFDPSGDGIGLQVHSQLIEQVAYVLALEPKLKKWIPKTFFTEAQAFVDKHWAKVGLLRVPHTWEPRDYREATDPALRQMSGPALNPYKGRHVPGHSILPNLLMYEVTRRNESGRGINYLTAAISQAQYVIREMDWRDPRHTKGHRMSEHKMITGLVWLQQNYPEQAPSGLKKKLEDWADVAISRSDNLWDFRRYDLGDHWTIPVMNEPGNLGGFPACALSVSWVIEDSAKKKRLREIAFAALDCLLGRNPINSASPHHPERGWNGMIERGWPVGFPNGTTARLETCRGSLSSGPGSEMYPFNPRGKPRFPEGWSAFNSALNVGLAYIEMDSKSHAGLPPECINQKD